MKNNGRAMKHGGGAIRVYILAAVLTTRGAFAQESVRDGVHAIVLGDYETAARILRPLSEGPRDLDPVAQFFMAMLYDSGRGVTRNQIRACGLYLSSATSSNPLVNQALSLARMIQEPYSGAWSGERVCFSAATHPWREPPPASFALAVDHSVVINATGTTVSYKGIQYHNPTPMGGAGLVYLPIRYTPIDVSNPTQTRRHFIQSFMWHPDGRPEESTWSLAWKIEEVIGPKILSVTGNPRLVSVKATQPPSSFDVTLAAGIRVNANGEAEWVTGSGPAEQSSVIAFKGRP